MGSDIVHEGKRVFARGKGAWRTIGELWLYFVIAGLVLPLIRDASFALALTIAAIAATASSLGILMMARGRVQVTRSEVPVRRWVRTRVIPRPQIAEVVHIRRLHVMGMPAGYVALLDPAGAPLWRSSSEAWTPDTLGALARVGQRRVTLDEAGPAEVAQRWPRLLPWSLAHPWIAFWGTTVGLLALVVVGVVIAIVIAQSVASS